MSQKLDEKQKKENNKIRSTSHTDPNASIISHNEKISISSIYKF